MVLMIMTIVMVLSSFLLLIAVGMFIIVRDSNSPWAKKIRYKLAGKKATYRLTDSGNYIFPENIMTQVEHIAYSVMLESKNNADSSTVSTVGRSVRIIKEFECSDYKIYSECLEYMKLHLKPIDARFREYPDENVDIEFVSVELSTLANKLAKRRTLNY